MLKTVAPPPRREQTEQAIAVYRRHAARAMAEERWAAADVFLDRILELVPRHTEAWLMKGHLRHHCTNDPETAIACYRKVITLGGHDPQHPHVARARASLSRLIGALGG